MGKHYGDTIIADVLEQKVRGNTNREIGEKHGLTARQIEQLVNGHNRKSRLGYQAPKPKGRPKTQGMTEEQKKDLKIKKLEMEVDLRSFLQAAGRM